MKNIFIYLILFLFSQNWIQAQNKNWDIIIDKEIHTQYGTFICETDSFYFVIGNSIKTVPTSELGFSVLKLSKINGQVISRTYYGEENLQLNFSYVKNLTIENGSIVIPMTSRGSLFLYKVELNTLKIEKVATIATLNYKGFFLYDFISTDKYYYLSGSLLTDSISLSHIVKVDKVTFESTFIKLNDDPKTTQARCIIAYNEGILVALEQNGTEIVTAGIKFMHFSTSDELLWQYETPTIVPNFDCVSLLQINPIEFLYVSTDPKLNYAKLQVENRASIMRFNTDTKKSSWHTWWDEPRKPHVLFRSEVIKGFRDNEFLLMANNSVIFDTFNYGTGKIVKFNGEGKRIWQKTYYRSNKWAVNNTFEDFIATADSCYLIVGSQFLARSAWLIKIDEDGNILPIDTVSATVEWTVPSSTTEISIYPNPAASSIIINQGEISDVQYLITDMTGRTIQQITVASAHQNTIWDISELPCGSYIITMMKDQKVIGQIRQVVVK